MAHKSDVTIRLRGLGLKAKVGSLRRIFEGEDYAKRLVMLLNTREAPYMTRRSEQLRAAILALRELVEIAAGDNRNHEKLTLDFPVEGLGPELTKRVRRLKKITQEAIGGVVKVFYHLHRIAPTGRVEIGYMTVPDTRKRGRPDRLPRLIEQDFIHNLVNLAACGRLLALRQCEYCHQWFFARYSHQRCCTPIPGKTSCQVKRFRSSEKFKSERRKKARQNYWLHNNTSVVTKKSKSKSEWRKS